MFDAREIAQVGLQGKVALITGGGAGIGRSIAESYAALGMKIAIIEIDAKRAAAVQESLGPDALVFTGNADDIAQVNSAIAAIDAEFGRLDVLVNNVGDFLMVRDAFGDTTEAQWDALYRVNLRNMFVVTRAAIPLLRKAGGGSIVNVSTIEAFRGIPKHTIYAAFKAGITGFTQSLAVELGPENIRVNAIAPETTNSEQVKATTRVPPQNKDWIARWFPIGRFGEPSDSAGAAVFLASEALSGWVSGTTIHVDGGALAAGSWLRMEDGNWTHLPVIDRDGYKPPSS
ncbi:MAG TPA: SDR family NAD(P)-dependent oxidoreductase [Alphaproteobacteria bacterium]|jgi:NAD(P)-dependent dehydrogenase (short-subunit alcohol dehydrogenase family)|nr:SDR family NAD(P)-dependent oxidoreductase [Alphaproteobacteria bacterium]